MVRIKHARQRRGMPSMFESKANTTHPPQRPAALGGPDTIYLQLEARIVTVPDLCVIKQRCKENNIQFKNILEW